MKKYIKEIKQMLSIKNNKIIAIIVLIALIVLLGIAIFLKFTGSDKNNFTLNPAYKVYPEEVRKLYSNVVEVSCHGDLHFNIEVGSGEKKVVDIDNNNLLDYMFSYLDKNNLLTDNMEESLIKKTEKDLFFDDVNLVNKIKDYNYGDYVYNVNGNTITRKKGECVSNDVKYVLHLFGYSYNKNMLSVDINVAYLKDGMLYNFDDVELGEYDGDVSKLFKLTAKTSYYRLNYVRKNDDFKLSSIEWNRRA